MPAEAVQQLADAIAADQPPQDEAEEALEETPPADLAPLAESPLDVLETTEEGTDREVQTAPADAESEAPTSSAGVAPAVIDFSAAATPPQDDSDDAGPEQDDTAEPQDTDAEGDDESENRDGDGSRRRRRRRGGRRRRRTGGDDDSADSDDSDSADSGTDSSGTGTSDAEAAGTPAAGDETRSPAAAGDEEGSSDDDSSDDAEGDGSRRRRRRRRRRGEDTGAAADDPGEVVVRVREPRRANTKSASSEVTGIEGSTRMEAKRQRRRDGREAGRRRVPILSEAEFLARRESVTRKMIIRQGEDLSQIAVIEDDILVEHYVDRDSAASLIGNVYLGRVQNVLPSMEAAFVDIGRGRNAVLYAGEVDWDSFGAEGQGRKVERVLKSGQTILVQVTKDPVGAKGARLTNHVSIPGRYIVYAPSGHLSGISRKLPDNERRRLKDILADLIGEASVIVRTAAEGASEEELVRDVNRLKAQWADIEKKVSGGQSPQLLYGEPDLTVRIVRDLFTEDFSELIIQGNGQANDAYDAVDAYVTHVAPHLKDRLRAWDTSQGRDLFAEYRLDEQIAKGLERKVFLPSGGSLVIDRTEAMTVIDVNTGKFTGSGGNLEATVTSNNLEAAEEIVRQLRLRDIGGIIVIDFIDMVLPNNRELLLRRLVECLGRDRTRHQVAEVTSLGLVQMTRKKIGTGLAEAFTSECPHCHGRGYEVHDMPVESQRQADGGARESGRRDNRKGGSGHQGGPARQQRQQRRQQGTRAGRAEARARAGSRARSRGERGPWSLPRARTRRSSRPRSPRSGPRVGVAAPAAAPPASRGPRPSPTRRPLPRPTPRASPSPRAERPAPGGGAAPARTGAAPLPGCDVVRPVGTVGHTVGVTTAAGSSDPLVVAVIGAGPSGIYAAEALTAQSEVPVEVAVIDRLPVPFGLVRYGVAPDHHSIRSIRHTLERTLDRAGVAFYGDVTIGRDLEIDELRGAVDAVVYAYGAGADKRLGIEGEDLLGSVAAPEFVAWYCGHPDVHPDGHTRPGEDAESDVGQRIARLVSEARTAVVVGVGNVALDVARVLVKTSEELGDTDMAHEVLASLADKHVTDVHVLGRRGPAYTAFTTKELRELGQLPDLDLLLDAHDLELDASSLAVVEQDKVAARNVAVMREWAGRASTGASRRVHLHFWTRPTRLLGGDRVEAVELERTAISPDGFVVGTGELSTVPAELVVRSVGYRGVALPGVPYDASTGRVPHAEGRVIRDGGFSADEYVTGWIKRGPTGVIGTNKSDAVETVASLLGDVRAGRLAPAGRSGQLDRLLAGRGLHALDLPAWRRIDAAEVELGVRHGRLRTTLAHRVELLAAAEPVPPAP